MKPLLVGAIAVALVATVPPRGPEDVATLTAGARSTAATVVEADRERISRHLEAVERHLRAADVSHLTAAQRQARAAALDHLREYRERGVYPHNHDHAERTPYFVDEHGVHCAMAYLIARSGDEALVERVAATANNAFIRDLAPDPELRDWLDRNGMTVAEAAMVQPMYGGFPQPEPVAEPGPLHRHYAAVGTATLVADAVAAYLVVRGGRLEGPAAVGGLIAGTAGTLAAASILDHGADRRREVLAVANVAMGLATIGISVGSLLRGGDDEPAPDRTAASGTTVGLAPALIGEEARPGVAVSFRF